MPPREFLQLVIPDGTAPGSTLAVRRASCASTFPVKVPANALPGQKLHIEVAPDGEAHVTFASDPNRVIIKRRDWSCQELVYKAICNGGHLEVLRFLKEQCGCDLDAECTSEGETAACLAVTKGRFVALSALEVLGVNLSQPCNRDGETPAYVAVVRDKPEALQTLNAHGVNLSALCTGARETLAAAAVSHNKPEALKALKTLGVNLSAACTNKFETPAAVAVVTDQFEMLKLLKELGVDMAAVCNEDGDEETLAAYAAFLGNVEVLRFLHQSGVDLAAECNNLRTTPACQAAYFNRADVLCLLHECDVDLSKGCNRDGYAPAGIAACMRGVDALHALHKCGYDLAAPCSPCMRTPAQLACLSGAVQSAVALKQLRVDFCKADLSWCAVGDRKMRAFLLRGEGGGLGRRLWRKPLLSIMLLRRFRMHQLELEEQKEIAAMQADLAEELEGHFGATEDVNHRVYVAAFQCGWQAGKRKRDK